MLSQTIVKMKYIQCIFCIQITGQKQASSSSSSAVDPRTPTAFQGKSHQTVKHAAFPRLEGWTAEDSVKVWALLNIQQCLEAVANLLVITSVFYHSKSKSRLDLDAEGPSSHAFGVICYVHSYSCSHTCAHDCGYD